MKFTQIILLEKNYTMCTSTSWKELYNMYFINFLKRIIQYVLQLLEKNNTICTSTSIALHFGRWWKEFKVKINHNFPKLAVFPGQEKNFPMFPFHFPNMGCNLPHRVTVTGSLHSNVTQLGRYFSNYSPDWATNYQSPATPTHLDRFVAASLMITHSRTSPYLLKYSLRPSVDIRCDDKKYI